MCQLWLQAVRLLSRFYFLLDSGEDHEPKGHDWYETIMVNLVNRLTAEFIQGLK